ncbi:hypothetical protein DXX93_08020 [Thalassotalea euphylliae]|uniref:Uncharacterized protein n=1 Tax=Thalassotalea euphylliae TaxID=1655234 RepID=A0A3E0TQB2_9GAMM|nr:hypothetical protein DXX93_08020 [Thalassotalea euphylliae]
MIIIVHESGNFTLSRIFKHWKFLILRCFNSHLKNGLSNNINHIETESENKAKALKPIVKYFIKYFLHRV